MGSNMHFGLALFGGQWRKRVAGRARRKFVGEIISDRKWEMRAEISHGISSSSMEFLLDVDVSHEDSQD